MAKALKKKAPSRVRYEQGHPTVSCRIPRDIYERLQAVKEVEGKSFTDILKVGLGILEVEVKREEEVRRRGYSEGYKKGYADAERTYKVTYPCIVCRKPLTVKSREEKEAVKEYMLEHRWGHKQCHEKRRKGLT